MGIAAPTPGVALGIASVEADASQCLLCPGTVQLAAVIAGLGLLILAGVVALLSDSGRFRGRRPCEHLRWSGRDA